MKKSMIIAIIVVYIISIVAVNFFGLEMKDFEGLIYATDFECEVLKLTEDGRTPLQYTTDSTTNNTTYFFAFEGKKGDYNKENATDEEVNPNIVLIQYRVIPDNVDNKYIKIRELAPNDNYIFDEATATVYFVNPDGMALFELSTTDGSNIKKKITIWAYEL